MNRRRHISAIAAKKLENAGIEELRTLLDRTSSKLYQTELLLSVTQKISGLKKNQAHTPSMHRQHLYLHEDLAALIRLRMGLLHS